MQYEPVRTCSAEGRGAIFIRLIITESFVPYFYACLRIYRNILNPISPLLRAAERRQIVFASSHTRADNPVLY